jgi:DNA-binding NarL/FixJ family response regulator
MKAKRQSYPAAKSDDSQKIQTFLAHDSPVLMTLLARILSKDERVIIAGSANDGWKALCYASTLLPDLVIVGLHLPGLDGEKLVRNLKQQQNPPTIFVVTSDDSPETRAKCLAAGADAFLLKTKDLSVRLNAAVQGFWPRRSAILQPSAGFRKTSRRRA